MIAEDIVKDGVKAHHYPLKDKRMNTVCGSSVLLLCDSWMLLIDDAPLKFLVCFYGMCVLLCLAQTALRPRLVERKEGHFVILVFFLDKNHGEMIYFF